MYVNVCKQQDHPKPHLSALVAATELHPPPQTQFFGNSFFSLPKCKVVFVRWYLTCKVVPYEKILVENERPYKKPCKVVPYKKII